MSKTIGDVVREEGAKFGFANIPAGEVEAIVWEETGYPFFWPDDKKTPEESFRGQLREFFEASRKKGALDHGRAMRIMEAQMATESA